MDTEKLIRELVKALDLEGLVDGHRDRLLIVDTQIRAFNKLGVEYREKLTELNNVIDQLKAICTVCGRLNILVGSYKGKGKQEPQDNETVIEKLADWY